MYLISVISLLPAKILKLSIHLHLLRKSLKIKKLLSLGKGLAELFPDEVRLTNDTLDELDHEYLELFGMLNKQGKLKAIEIIEILTKVPEFVMMLEDNQVD